MKWNSHYYLTRNYFIFASSNNESISESMLSYKNQMNVVQVRMIIIPHLYISSHIFNYFFFFDPYLTSGLVGNELASGASIVWIAQIETIVAIGMIVKWSHVGVVAIFLFNISIQFFLWNFSLWTLLLSFKSYLSYLY